MFRRFYPVIIIAALASLALLNASCGSTLSPTEALAASADQFSEVFSFQAHVKSTVTSSDRMVSSEGTAAYALKDLAYLSLLTTSEGAGKSDRTETLLVPPDFYMRTPDGQWYVLSPWHQGTRPEEVPDLSFDEDLLDYQEIVSQMERVRKLPDETIDGAAYMRFAGDLPFEDAFWLTDDEPSAKGMFAVELWVNKQTLLPHRMQTSTQVRAEPGKLRVETEIRFEYNETIFVPPVPRQTRPWRDLEFPDAPCTGSRFESCLAAQTALAPIAKPSCDGPGRRVCLAPLGQIDPSVIEQLVEHYRVQYGLEVIVLTPLAVPAKVADPKRQQVDADTLLLYAGINFRAAYNDPEAVLIGITPLDLYDSDSHFRYIFGAKRIFSDPKGVVSTFRMNPRFYGDPPDSGLLITRTRKLVTKYVGMLYYGLPTSRDPASPMYDPILGLTALDAMGEPLPVRPGQ